MTEMEERVAVAVNRSAHCDWRLETCKAGICQCKVLARAAIAAMREPTQEMRLAGIAEYARPDPTTEHESTLVFNAIWRAMIDAAFNEKSPTAS